MRSQPKPTRKTRWRDVFFPNFNTPEGIKTARQHGIVAAVWLAFGYAVTIAYGLSTGRSLFPEKSVMDAPIDVAAGADLEVAFGLVAIALGLVLAWLVWKKGSRVAAGVVLCWVLIEVIYKQFLLPGRGLVMAALLLLFAVNGYRSTEKRPAAAEPVALSERDE